MDPIRSQLSQEVHGLSRNAEGQIVEAITKILHSRTFLDNLGSSVSTAMGPVVQNTCRDVYSKMLIPGINALTQQVVKQVNDIFSKGTRESKLYQKAIFGGDIPLRLTRFLVVRCNCSTILLPSGL
ncbi:hypothetical protein SK128_021750 [Halocaridina rubra]|uniref:Uncharacterized protein n=1 Tax=Halocaridina rubra TaxID=373956 RepID=A0AAN9A1V2_HALRR